MNTKKMLIISDHGITDAAMNLALEEYCVRKLDPGQDYLRLYVNRPAVIIGAHQNPWEEVNAGYLKKEGIPIIRRMSGGGAVYHDKGNLNICCITNHHREKFGRFEIFTQPIVDTLNRLGIPAVHAHQNIIAVQGKKISGNAQFTNMKRMFSHGTLLFDADLDALAQSLKSNFKPVFSKGIQSIKREVTNIKDFLKTPISLDTFIKTLLNDISKGYESIKKYDLSHEGWAEIHQLADRKYRTWEWVYGRTPKFSVKENCDYGNGYYSVLISVEKGVIQRIESEENRLSEKEPPGILNRLVGQRYAPDVVQRALNG